MNLTTSKTLRGALMVTIGAGTWMVGCGEGGTSSTQPAGEVVKYGPAPQDSYHPKIGRRGGRFVMSSFGEGLKSFNPITAGETSTTDYTARIFEALVFEDPWTREVKPAVAESWEHSDDYLVWTFHLRKDVKFNNGMPLTADDVVYTFTLIYDPDITCSSRDLLMVDDKPWKVEKVDDHTVRITLPSTYAIFLNRMASQDLGIICKAVCEPPHKAGKFNSFMGAEAKPEEVVGTGPFMLDSYVPGQRLNLKRNPYYWRKDAAGNQLPYLDGMVVTWSQTADQMMLKFKAGETDVYGLRGTDYPILKPLEKKGDFKIYELGPLFGSEFIFFNQNTGKNPATGQPYVEPYKLAWFRNTKFRQAISHAIDREGLVKTVHNGLAFPQYGPESPSTGYFYNDKLKPYDYNLDKAKALLAEIGLKDRNGDHLLEDEQGHVVQFTLMTNAGNNIREQTAEIARKDMDKLGIKVDLKYIEFNTLISKMDETYDWEAIVMGLTGGPEPHDGCNVWKSSGRTHQWFPRQKSPSTDWEKRIDEIFDAGIKEMDPAKRKVLYDEWQVIANEQQPFIWTTAAMGLGAIRNKFENVYPTPIAMSYRQATSWNIWEMCIEEGSEGVRE
jgi:peptide/nickel transport system substrate-binding protein